MRKRSAALLVALVAAGLTPVGASGQASLFLGKKALESAWEPFEDQGEVGVQITFGSEAWPVLLAIDLLGSSEEQEVLGVDVEADTWEVAVGARRIWGEERTHPFFGGGLAFIHGQAEGQGAAFALDDSDGEIGFWIDGGVFFRLGPRFNIGLDARASHASIDLLGGHVDAGGVHLGLLVGWGF
jgi:hypothetical protein